MRKILISVSSSVDTESPSVLRKNEKLVHAAYLKFDAAWKKFDSAKSKLTAAEDKQFEESCKATRRKALRDSKAPGISKASKEKILLNVEKAIKVAHKKFLRAQIKRFKALDSKEDAFDRAATISAEKGSKSSTERRIAYYKKLEELHIKGTAELQQYIDELKRKPANIFV